MPSSIQSTPPTKTPPSTMPLYTAAPQPSTTTGTSSWNVSSSQRGARVVISVDGTEIKVIDIFRGCTGAGLIALAKYGANRRNESFSRDRLGKKVIHSRGDTGFLSAFHRMGGQSDNGCVRAGFFVSAANHFGRLQATHLQHLQVHQYDVE